MFVIAEQIPIITIISVILTSKALTSPFVIAATDSEDKSVFKKGETSLAIKYKGTKNHAIGYLLNQA